MPGKLYFYPQKIIFPTDHSAETVSLPLAALMKIAVSDAIDMINN